MIIIDRSLLRFTLTSLYGGTTSRFALPFESPLLILLLPPLYVFLSFSSNYSVRFSSCSFTETGSVKNHSFSLLLTLSAAERRVSQLQRLTRPFFTPRSPSLPLKRLNRTIIYFLPHLRLVRAKRYHHRETESIPR